MSIALRRGRIAAGANRGEEADNYGRIAAAASETEMTPSRTTRRRG
jgi:hypothetical protein